MAELPKVSLAVLNAVAHRSEPHGLIEHLRVDNPHLVEFVVGFVQAAIDNGDDPTLVALTAISISLKCVETELDVQLTKRMVGD